MALAVRRQSPAKVRIITTLVALFALVAQPMYGLVAGQVANATPGGDTYYVATTGSDSDDCGPADDPCATINKAVDNANAGDKVRVNAGEYDENVQIDKEINLKALGAVTINNKSNGRYTVELKGDSASGTAISGFTINNQGGKVALKIEQTASISDLNINNNTFSSTGSNLVYAGGLNSSHFKGNTFKMQAGNYGANFEGVSSTLKFNSNDFTGTTDKVAFSAEATGSSKFKNNDLSDLTSTYAKIVELRNGSSTEAVDTVYGNNQVAINPNSNNFRGVYNKISEALGVAESDDTVFVQPGTYNENVSINKSVNLLGSGQGATKIIGQAGGTKGAVNIAKGVSNVELSRFTIQPGAARSATLNIESGGSSATPNTNLDIHNNIIDAVGNGYAVAGDNLQSSAFRNNLIRTNGVTPSILFYIGGEGGDNKDLTFNNNRFTGDLGVHLAFSSNAVGNVFTNNKFYTTTAPGKDKLVEFLNTHADATNGGNVYPMDQRWQAVNPGTDNFKGVYRGATELGKVVASGDKVVLLDNVSPAVQISSPSANGVIKGNKVVIEGTATDDNFNYYYCYVTKRGEVGTRDALCQTAWALGTKSKTAFAQTTTGTENGTLGSVNLAGLDDGNYTVHVVAKDKAGNTTKATKDFVLDNTRPVSVITSPANGLTTDGNTLTVNGTATDTNFEKYRYYIWDVNNKIPAGQKQYHFNHEVNSGESLGDDIDISGLVDGTYRLRLSVQDKAGNWLASYATFTIDRTSATEDKENTNSGGGPESSQGSNTTGGSEGLLPPVDTGGVNTPVANPGQFASTARSFFAVQNPIVSDQPISDEDVLGAKTAEKPAANDTVAAIAPSAQGWKVFGLAWFWWVLILAAAVGLWLMIAAGIRNRKEA